MSIKRSLRGLGVATGLLLGLTASAIVNPAGEFAGANSSAADTRLDAVGSFSMTNWLNGTHYPAYSTSPKAIAGITLSGANPVRVTVTAHGYTPGGFVIVKEVVGTVELNGLEYTITVVDPDTFTLDGTVSSNFTAYVSGGTTQPMSFQTDNWHGGATLIAPQLIVTAKHNLNNATHPSQIPVDYYCVRFRRQLDNSVRYLAWDPGDGTHLPFYAKVKRWVFPPSGQDIAIGILEEPVTHITPISASLTIPSVGNNIILAGWGSYSQTQGSGSPRDGLRDTGSSPYKQISSVSASGIGWPNSYPPTTWVVNMHDSGGAILKVNGSVLSYIGDITSYGFGPGLGQFSGTDFGRWLQGEMVQYTLTYTVDGHGSITGPTPQTVEHGEDGIAVTAVADPGYHFLRWSDGSTSNPRQETFVTASLSLEAHFGPTQANYSVVFRTDGRPGGTLTGGVTELTLTVAHAGNSSPVEALPAASDKFTNWTGDVVSAENPLIVTNVLENMVVVANFHINTYVLIYTRPRFEPGNIYGGTYQVVEYGSDGQPVLAVPNFNCHFVGWSDASTANPRTDFGVIANLNVSADFESGAPTSAILAMAVDGDGTTTPAPGLYANIPPATPQSISAIPGVGQHFVEWTVTDGASVATPLVAETEVTIAAGYGYGSATANFGVNQYLVIFETDGTAGASLTGTTPQTIDHGADGAAVTANAPAGWTFLNWTKGGVEYSTDPTLTISNVTETMTLTANYGADCQLTYLSGPNGMVNGDPLVTQIVPYGSDGPEVSPEPNLKGWRFTNWSDGSTANPRQDLSVTGDLTVTANFSNLYLLTYTAGPHGTINSAAQVTQVVAWKGAGPVVDPQPATGYHFVNWSDLSTADPRQDNPVGGALELTANFGINQYLVIFETDGTAGASLTGTTPQTIDHGADGAAVTANAPAGWHFTKWTRGGANYSSAISLTVTKVTSAMTLTANFAPNGVLHQVVFRAGSNGTVNGEAVITQAVYQGEDCRLPVTAIADVDYEFLSWTGDYVGTANPLTITNVTTDLTIDANFAAMEKVASGSQFEVDHAEAGLDQFRKGPKIWGTYYDPIKDPTPLKEKKASTKVLTKILKDTAVSSVKVEWKKKVRLYDAKGFKGEQKTGTGAILWLTRHPVLDLEIPLHAAVEEYGIPSEPDLRTVALASPRLDEVRDQLDQLELTELSGRAGQQLLLKGHWFGVKPPKVWLEYRNADDAIKCLKLKAIKPYAFDAGGKVGNSVMDPDTGASEVFVQLPDELPDGIAAVVIENGVGLAAQAITN